jgi:hypothetical protein
MRVFPDKQFSSFASFQAIMPYLEEDKSNHNESKAILYGKSKFGNYLIKLSWTFQELVI